MKVLPAEEGLTPERRPFGEKARFADDELASADSGSASADEGGGRLQVSRVCDGILLSAAAAAAVPARLERLGVTLVVGAAVELPDTPLPPGARLLRVPLADSAAQDLSPHLDAVADALHEELVRGGTALVHCVAGVSRSASLCLAFLVKHGGLSLRDAWAVLRRRRPCVRPNCAFWRALVAFEARVRGAASVHMVTHDLAPDAPHGKSVCMPDVYEEEYQATLWLRRQYPRRLGRV